MLLRPYLGSFEENKGGKLQKKNVYQTWKVNLKFFQEAIDKIETTKYLQDLEKP